MLKILHRVPVMTRVPVVSHPCYKELNIYFYKIAIFREDNLITWIDKLVLKLPFGFYRVLTLCYMSENLIVTFFVISIADSSSFTRPYLLYLREIWNSYKFKARNVLAKNSQINNVLTWKCNVSGTLFDTSGMTINDVKCIPFCVHEVIFLVYDLLFWFTMHPIFKIAIWLSLTWAI